MGLSTFLTAPFLLINPERYNSLHTLVTNNGSGVMTFFTSIFHFFCRILIFFRICILKIK